MYFYIGGRESIVVMIIIFIMVLIMVNLFTQPVSSGGWVIWAFRLMLLSLGSTSDLKTDLVIYSYIFPPAPWPCWGRGGRG